MKWGIQRGPLAGAGCRGDLRNMFVMLTPLWEVQTERERDKLLTCVTTQCGTESSFCLDVCGASLMMIFLAFTAIFSLMADAASENCSRKGNEVVRSMHAPGCFIGAISSSRASRGLSSGASWRRVKVFRPERTRAEKERGERADTYNKARANGTT